MSKKRILIIAAAAALVAIITVLVICLIPKERELTDLEKVTLKDQSAVIMRYMEEIDATGEDDDALPEKLSDIKYDRWIAYALEYSHGEDKKDTLTTSEIKALIESKFDVTLEEEKIANVGISPRLLEKNIDNNIEGKTYTINRSNLTKRDIAAIPIDVYLEKETKANGSDYIISYDKYNIKNPYDAVPYATNDMAKVTEYLNGKGDVSAIKQILTSENAEQIATHKKQTTVKYTMKNDKIIVVSIK